jgi:hypothetical protein
MTEQEAVSILINKRHGHIQTQSSYKDRMWTTVGKFLQENGYEDLAQEIKTQLAVTYTQDN